VLGIGRATLRTGVGSEEGLSDQRRIQLRKRRPEDPAVSLQEARLVDAGPLIRGDRRARTPEGDQEAQPEKQGGSVEGETAVRPNPLLHPLRVVTVRRLGQDLASRCLSGVHQLHSPPFGRDVPLLTPTFGVSSTAFRVSRRTSWQPTQTEGFAHVRGRIGR
jgi:hypothetical protein